MATEVRTALLRRVDAASLTAFRVAFGALLLVAVARHLAYGWVTDLFVTPRVFFPYPGLEWIAPLRAPGMHILYVALAVCAAAILFGIRPRACAAVFCLGFTWTHLIDRSNYLNHYYLVSLLSGLLAVLPAPRDGTVPAWAVWLLRFQLAVVYVFGALAKLTPDWLLQAQPLRLWLGANIDLPLLGPWLELPWVAFAASWAGLLFDACIVPLLLWPRARTFAYAAVIAFHLFTALLFPIGLFPWLMIGLTPIFLAPDWPRRVFARVLPAAPPSASAVGPWRPAIAALVGLFVLLQVGLPLRHHVLAGDLYWHEAGFRWSWQIMAMEKFGRAVFTVVDAASGAVQTARPLDELTPLQARMLATQPDMLLSYARRLAARADRPVHVYADVLVSLNGRPAAPLVDPGVDLAALPDDPTPGEWLTASPEQALALAFEGR